MAIITEFFLPPTGEDMDEVRLVGWLVEEGDSFEPGTVLLEIETDKSIIEVPAQQSGRLIEKLFNVDAMVGADKPVARIEVEALLDVPPEGGESDAELPASTPAAAEADTAATVQTSAPQPSIPALQVSQVEGSQRRFATPAARYLAREQGVSLASVAGSGPDQRITLADVRAVATQSVGAVAMGKGRHERYIDTDLGKVYVEVTVPQAARPLPPVVLLHGMFGDSTTWAGVAHALLRSGLTVCTVDLPAHGRSAARVKSVSKVVDALAHALRQAVPGSFILVGHSLGAALAVRLAAQAALPVTGLALLSPAGLGTEINQAFLNGTLYAQTREALARELAKLAASKMPISDTFLDQMLTQLQTNQSSLADLSAGLSHQGVQQLNVLPDFETISVPVVAIHGRSDQIIPWQHALNLPGQVALHLLPQVGHTPHWEQTALVVDRLLDLAMR